MGPFDTRAAFDAVDKIAPASRLRVCTSEERPDLWARAVAPPHSLGAVGGALVANPSALPSAPSDYQVLVVDSALEQLAVDGLLTKARDILAGEVETGRRSGHWQYEADDVRLIVFPQP